MRKFRIEYTAGAIQELEEKYLWIKERAPMAAEKWREELILKVEGLAENPLGCPIAPESDRFSHEIRLLLFRKRRAQLRVY